MRVGRLLAVLVCASAFSACTTGVYYVSSRPAPDGDGLYRYRVSDGADRALGGTYQNGSSPHVAPDGALLYVKPVAGVRQVFRGSQQLTTSAGDKSYPRWSANWLAFEQTVGGVRSIVLRSHGGATEFTLASGVESGHAFLDSGQPSSLRAMTVYTSPMRRRAPPRHASKAARRLPRPPPAICRPCRTMERCLPIA